MEPLKEMFNKSYYENVADKFGKASKKFNSEKFLKDVMHDLSSLELNQRLRRTSEVLKLHLPQNFREAVGIMKEVVPQLNYGYTSLVFPDFVGLYGKEDFDFSLDALKYFTRFGSSEFAIREFLRLDFNRTIKVMKSWAEDESHHVRRLASEGSRPRLPWSFRLDAVIKDPKLTMPILEKLKADKELYVRKSVANHLNDISKDHPAFVLDVIKKWKGASPQTDWILKHASRTLLKKGDVQVLKHFGIKHSNSITLKNFSLPQKKIKTGGNLVFTFSLTNSDNKLVPLRLEYALYYRIANGSFSKKVFKISERELPGKSSVEIEKKHSFRIITTRKYYSGKHKIAVIVNGKEYEPALFDLL